MTSVGRYSEANISIPQLLCQLMRRQLLLAQAAVAWDASCMCQLMRQLLLAWAVVVALDVVS